MLYGVLMSSVVTRSGRISKKPERYEPQEDVEDDYTDDEDEDFSEDEDLCETDDEDEDSDDEDADDNGNLEGFVVSDDDEEEDA